MFTGHIRACQLRDARRAHLVAHLDVASFHVCSYMAAFHAPCSVCSPVSRSDIEHATSAVNRCSFIDFQYSFYYLRGRSSALLSSPAKPSVGKKTTKSPSYVYSTWFPNPAFRDHSKVLISARPY